MFAKTHPLSVKTAQIAVAVQAIIVKPSSVMVLRTSASNRAQNLVPPTPIVRGVRAVMAVVVVTVRDNVFLWANVHRKHKKRTVLRVRFVMIIWSVSPHLLV